MTRTIADNPHLQPHPAEAVAAADARPPAPEPARPPEAAAPPPPTSVVSPNVLDVVDPETFNREHHPERYGGGKP